VSNAVLPDCPKCGAVIIPCFREGDCRYYWCIEHAYVVQGPDGNLRVTGPSGAPDVQDQSTEERCLS
jgi:hypothetical protein